MRCPAATGMGCEEPPRHDSTRVAPRSSAERASTAAAPALDSLADEEAELRGAISRLEREEAELHRALESSPALAAFREFLEDKAALEEEEAELLTKLEEAEAALSQVRASLTEAPTDAPGTSSEVRPPFTIPAAYPLPSPGRPRHAHHCPPPLRAAAARVEAPHSRGAPRGAAAALPPPPSPPTPCQRDDLLRQARTARYQQLSDAQQKVDVETALEDQETKASLCVHWPLALPRWHARPDKACRGVARRPPGSRWPRVRGGTRRRRGGARSGWRSWSSRCAPRRRAWPPSAASLTSSAWLSCWTRPSRCGGAPPPFRPEHALHPPLPRARTWRHCASGGRSWRRPLPGFAARWRRRRRRCWTRRSGSCAGDAEWRGRRRRRIRRRGLTSLRPRLPPVPALTRRRRAWDERLEEERTKAREQLEAREREAKAKVEGVRAHAPATWEEKGRGLMPWPHATPGGRVPAPCSPLAAAAPAGEAVRGGVPARD